MVRHNQITTYQQEVLGHDHSSVGTDKMRIGPGWSWVLYRANNSTVLVRRMSINQSIYFLDRHVRFTIIFMNLVVSYDFRKICWPDVRRGNRCVSQEMEGN